MSATWLVTSSQFHMCVSVISIVPSLTIPECLSPCWHSHHLSQQLFSRQVMIPYSTRILSAIYYIYIIVSSFCSLHYTHMTHPCFSFLQFFKFYYLFICVCLCSVSVLMHTCVCVVVPWHACGGQKAAMGVISLHHGASGNWTGIRLGSKCPYPLSCPLAPCPSFPLAHSIYCFIWVCHMFFIYNIIVEC